MTSIFCSSSSITGTFPDFEYWFNKQLFRCSKFLTAEDVLAASRYMAAVQISREPLVRHCVREIYYERAKITVRPTKKGIKVCVFHCSSVLTCWGLPETVVVWFVGRIRRGPLDFNHLFMGRSGQPQQTVFFELQKHLHMWEGWY